MGFIPLGGAGGAKQSVPVAEKSEEQKVRDAQQGGGLQEAHYVNLRQQLDDSAYRERKLLDEALATPSVFEQLGALRNSQIATGSTGARGASALSNTAAIRGSVPQYWDNVMNQASARGDFNASALDQMAGLGLRRAGHELAVEDLYNQELGYQSKDYAARSALAFNKMQFDDAINAQQNSANAALAGSAVAGAGSALMDLLKNNEKSGVEKPYEGPARPEDVVYTSDERAKSNIQSTGSNYGESLRKMFSNFAGMVPQAQQIPPGYIMPYARPIYASGIATKTNVQPVGSPPAATKEPSQNPALQSNPLPAPVSQDQRTEQALAQLPKDLKVMLMKGMHPRQVLRILAERERVNDNAMKAEEIDRRADAMEIPRSQYSAQDVARAMVLRARESAYAAGLQPVVNQEGKQIGFSPRDDHGVTYQNQDFETSVQATEPARQRVLTIEDARRPASTSEYLMMKNNEANMTNDDEALMNAAQPISYSYKPEWQKMLGPGSEGQRVGVNATEIGKTPLGQQLVQKVDSPKGPVETLQPDKVVGASLGFSALNAKKNMELQDRLAKLESMIFNRA